MVKDGITNPQIGIWVIINERKNRRKVMPMVNGKKYAYTKKGKAAAKKAMKKNKKKK